MNEGRRENLERFLGYLYHRRSDSSNHIPGPGSAASLVGRLEKDKGSRKQDIEMDLQGGWTQGVRSGTYLTQAVELNGVDEAINVTCAVLNWNQGRQRLECGCGIGILQEAKKVGKVRLLLLFCKKHKEKRVKQMKEFAQATSSRVN